MPFIFDLFRLRLVDDIGLVLVLVVFAIVGGGGGAGAAAPARSVVVLVVSLTIFSAAARCFRRVPSAGETTHASFKLSGGWGVYVMRPPPAKHSASPCNGGGRRTARVTNLQMYQY